MARHLTQRPLIPQEENLDALRKKSVISGNLKSSKVAGKKVGGGLGSRKALGDITNKATIHHESSSRKKVVPKEEFNIAEEKFLHDHRKCIESQQAAKSSPLWDIILPGYDPKSPVGNSDAKVQSDQAVLNERSYPEPAEIILPEFSVSLESATSYELFLPRISLDHLPDYSLDLNLEPVEFTLKEEECS